MPCYLITISLPTVEASSRTLLDSLLEVDVQSIHVRSNVNVKRSLISSHISPEHGTHMTKQFVPDRKHLLMDNFEHEVTQHVYKHPNTTRPTNIRILNIYNII
jgi:hypothetical protein